MKHFFKDETHMQMALGDVIGGFAIALLVFSYTGVFDYVTVGWVLIVVSALLHMPYINKHWKR